jgi:hypothetical protein
VCSCRTRSLAKESWRTLTRWPSINCCIRISLPFLNRRPRHDKCLLQPSDTPIVNLSESTLARPPAKQVITHERHVYVVSRSAD